MEIIYDGKTKCLLRVGDHAVLKFKDEVTGDTEGNPDPGGNLVWGLWRVQIWVQTPNTALHASKAALQPES